MMYSAQQIQELRLYMSKANDNPNDQKQQIQAINHIASIILNDYIDFQKQLNLNIDSISPITNNQQRSQFRKSQYRSYYTERNHKESDVKHQNEHFKCQDQIRSIQDYHKKCNNTQKMVLYDQELEKSQYLPVYRHKQNPQRSNEQPKGKGHQKQMEKLKEKQKSKSESKQKVKAKAKAKNAQNTNKTQMIGSRLTNPVKNFKKHILQDVDRKRKLQQEEQARFIVQQKSDIKQFYNKNLQHIPVYQKSKHLNCKKISAIQNSRIAKQFIEKAQTTFKPEINRYTKKIVDGTSFEERLQSNNIRKQINHKRIVYQTMQNSPFKPKTNENNLSQSKVKKIWMEKHSPVDEESSRKMVKHPNSQYLSEKNWYALKLSHNQAEKLFQS